MYDNDAYPIAGGSSVSRYRYEVNRQYDLAPPLYCRPWVEEGQIVLAIAMHTGLPHSVVVRLCLRYGALNVAACVPACKRVVDDWIGDKIETPLEALRAAQAAKKVREGKRV